MGRTQEPDGDYGYDLVHEEVGSGRRPDPGPESAPAPSRPDDQSGDYAYDEAHDF